MKVIKKLIKYILVFVFLIAEQSVFSADFEQEDLFFLGLTHLIGKTSERENVVAHNKQKAFESFKSAAEKGFVQAKRIVAFMYLKGIGVPQDREGAFKWYCAAAESGCTQSQYIVDSCGSNNPVHLEEPISGVDSDTLKMLREAIFQSKCAQGKDIVALIGNTGAGKSTAINDFTGHRIVFDEATETMKVEDGHALAKIGHNPVESKTLYTQIYPHHPLPHSSFILADCGGFLDTRKGCEIVAAVSLKLTLENARRVKIIICFDANNIKATRMSNFSKLLKKCFKDLIRDYQAFPDATMLMITKPPLYEVINRNIVIPYTLESAIQQLENACSYLVEDSVNKELFDHILRENGKYVAIYDPILEETKEHVMDILDEMEAIEEPKDVFKVAYSPQVRLDLTNIANEIAFRGGGLYKGFFATIEEVRRIIDEYHFKRSDLITISEDLESVLKGLESHKHEIEATIAAKEREIAELEAWIRRLRGDIKKYLGRKKIKKWKMKSLIKKENEIEGAEGRIRENHSIIEKGRRMIQEIDSNIESINKSIVKMDQLKKESEDLAYQGASLLFDLSKINDKIKANAKNFDFLICYLDLSKDEELENQHLVTDFMHLKKRFDESGFSL